MLPLEGEPEGRSEGEVVNRSGVGKCAINMKVGFGLENDKSPLRVRLVWSKVVFSIKHSSMNVVSYTLNYDEYKIHCWPA